MATLEWPRRSCITFTGAPAARPRVVCVAKIVHPALRDVGLAGQLTQLADHRLRVEQG